MSPWTALNLSPEERWHDWWAWHPVVIRRPGQRVVVFFETIQRRLTENGWEYQLPD